MTIRSRKTPATLYSGSAWRNWRLKKGRKRFMPLAAADPEAAAAIHQNNTRRVIRALEILHVSGKQCQSILKPKTGAALQCGSYRSYNGQRSAVRINERVDLMLETYS